MAAAGDIISKLPVEIVQEIFMRVSPEGLRNVQKCCKKWRCMVSSAYFWKKKLKIDFTFVDQENLKTENYQKYIENFSSNLEGQYTYTRELIRNWRKGIFNTRIVSLPNKVEAQIYLDDQILIAVVERYTILIIDISTGTIVKSIFAENVDYVEKSGDKLYAQCRSPDNFVDAQLKVWNLQSFELIFDLQTDITDFRRYEHMIYKHLIMFISSDPDVLNIFNLETGKLDYRKVGFSCVHCSNDIIAKVTSLGIIEIMDLNYNPLMTYDCYNGDEECEVIKIEMKDDNLVTLFQNPSEEYTICVYNLKTKVKSYTIKKLPVEHITFFNGNILICEVEDTEIFTVFDVLTGKTILEFSADDRLNFMSNDLFIFMENLETSCIEMWCPRTKSLIKKFDLPEKYSVTYGGNYYLKLFPLISKTNLVFLNLQNPSELLVMDFGPKIIKK